MEVIDWCEDQEADELEQSWIATCESCGAELLNGTETTYANGMRRMVFFIEEETYQEIVQIAGRQQSESGERVTAANILRQAAEDYVSRNRKPSKSK